MLPVAAKTAGARLRSAAANAAHVLRQSARFVRVPAAPARELHGVSAAAVAVVAANRPPVMRGQQKLGGAVLAAPMPVVAGVNGVGSRRLVPVRDMSGLPQALRFPASDEAVVAAVNDVLEHKDTDDSVESLPRRAKARELIKRNPDALYYNDRCRGVPVLGLAAEAGDEYLVLDILKAGADPNKEGTVVRGIAKGKAQYVKANALRLAAKSDHFGCYQVVQVLLQYGALPDGSLLEDVANKANKHPNSSAPAILNLLKQEVAKQKGLVTAVQLKDLEAVEGFLQAGARFSPGTIRSISNSQAETSGAEREFYTEVIKLCNRYNTLPPRPQYVPPVSPSAVPTKATAAPSIPAPCGKGAVAGK